MSETNELKGKRIKLFLKDNGYVYRGECLGIEEGFLILLDDKTAKKMLFGVSNIAQVEVFT